MEKQVTLFWFRRDLRLEDNTGLYYALQEKSPVLPLFIFDTRILNDLEDCDDARVTFIHQTITHLHEQLAELGSSLWVAHTEPQLAFKNLFEQYDVQAVFTNRDYEPYAKERDAAIEQLCQDHGVMFLDFKDQVIFEHKEITTDADDSYYKVYTPYKRKWLAKAQQTQIAPLDLTPYIKKNLLRIDPLPMPSLEELGFRPTERELPPRSVPKDIIRAYADERNFPAKRGTTRLGIHLRFGTLSIRRAVQIGYELDEVWLSELIWREFYMMILANEPRVVNEAFKKEYDAIPWRDAPEDFERWCAGETGYPIVDAGMRELKETGFMHNRVRMIVASFLTKHLLIDWRLGEAWFARHLLDYELASNNGGWQWAAGTGTDAQPYFRIFNPYSQTDKFDPDKRYIRKWVPEFEEQRYPEPMVDHKFARQRALDTYKEALGKK